MTVYIMRGLPGSGKSSWVENNLGLNPICSADNFFMVDGEYQFDPAKLPEAHKACLRSFVTFFDRDFVGDVIVDNTNMQLWELSPYLAFAEMRGHTVELINIQCPVDIDAARNTHGVPREAIKAMAARYEDPLPWWNQREIIFKG